MRGGFVGVDVFFVISGFPITSIIHRENEAKTFSFTQSCGRRIRRLMPALLLVVIATIAITHAIVFPPERPAIANQALAALFSISNLFF